MSENIAGTGLSAEQLRNVGLGALVPKDPQDEHPAFAEINAQRAEELRKRGEPHGLHADEVAAADQGGMDLARYAAMKGVANSDDFDREQERLAEQALVDAEARRQFQVERAKRRIAAERSGDEAA